MIKPRLRFVNGYWRVSPMPKPYSMYKVAWAHAHELAIWMNDQAFKERTERLKRKERLNAAYGRHAQRVTLQ